ncbi:hypothetical protein BpHYR1_011417 [Brachionus plicatilis]|uniref:Uncharacterized protein n=1 Tax=Brachionus plicatilis TaxID=10195 RepID=A0A3M7SAC8_BRAPC|nr:hypothetical protein BpHYR1_011417 [Brachionus plicatilis]
MQYGSLHKVKRTRGLQSAVKKFVLNIIRQDSNITPKTYSHTIQNIVNHYRSRSSKTNSIETVLELIRKNQYKNNIEEDKPFFFNFDYDEGGKIRIGNGSENDHLHICKA